MHQLQACIAHLYILTIDILQVYTLTCTQQLTSTILAVALSISEGETSVATCVCIHAYHLVTTSAIRLFSEAYYTREVQLTYCYILLGSKIILLNATHDTFATTVGNRLPFAVKLWISFKQHFRVLFYVQCTLRCWPNTKNTDNVVMWQESLPCV